MKNTEAKITLAEELFGKRFKELNPDEKSEYYRIHAAKWAKENPEKCKAKTKRWRKKNPEKNRIYDRKKIAKQRLELQDCYIRKKLKDSGYMYPTKEMVAIKKISLILKRLEKGRLDKDLKRHYLNIINNIKQEVLCS